MSTASFAVTPVPNKKPLRCVLAAVSVICLMLASCQAGNGQAEDGRTANATQANTALAAILETMVQAQSLATIVAIPTEFSMTSEDLQRLSADTEERKEALDRHLSILENGNYPELPYIRQLADRLAANADIVDSSRAKLHQLITESKLRTSLFSHQFSREMEGALVTILDNQFKEVLSQYEGDSGISQEDFVRYHHMHHVLSAVRSASIRIWSAAAFNIPAGLASIAQEGFNSEYQRLRHSLQYLADNGGVHADFEALESAWLFLAANTQERTVFESLKERRDLINQEEDAAMSSRYVMAELAERLNAVSQTILNST